MAALIGAVCPAGYVGPHPSSRLKLESISECCRSEGLCIILLRFLPTECDLEVFARDLEKVEKVGKKKNRIGCKDGAGVNIVVSVNLPRTQPRWTRFAPSDVHLHRRM